MASIAIQVEGLSKSYRIDRSAKPAHDTLADTIRHLGEARPWKKESLGQETFWALRNVHFRIEKGERVGIIGRNGAGKSTLLKLLSRITAPTEGQIILEGQAASLLEIGTGFHPDLTGRENIFLNGTLLGMRKDQIRQRFSEIVAFAETGDFLDTPVKYYSSGMYLRLAFSIAAHLEPEILMVDEVLAVGDAVFQQKCLGKMESVSRNEGRTVLFISHNLDAIRALCNRVIWLDQGKLVADGSPGEIIQAYLDRNRQVYEVRFTPQQDRPSITSAILHRKCLKDGVLDLEIHFESPYPLHPPIPGMILYNGLRMPVLGSNPRYHDQGFRGENMTSGSARIRIPNLELHTGHYSIDVWLGDTHQDYDHRPEALSFTYQNPVAYAHYPDPLYMGSIDKAGLWTLLETPKTNPT